MNETPAIWRVWLPRIYRAYAVGVGVCLAGAFTESFANLITYFRHQGLAIGLAVVAPSMVDIFTIGGEVLVLIATVNRWDWRAKLAGWAATFAGLAVSVAGNVGKDGWRIPLERAVAYAIAPLALAGLLALGLMIVKRVLHPPAGSLALEAPAGSGPEAGPLPDPAVALTVTPEPAPRPAPDLSTRAAATALAAAMAAIVRAAAGQPRPSPDTIEPDNRRPPDNPDNPRPANPRPRPAKIDPDRVRELRKTMPPAEVAALLEISERSVRRACGQPGLASASNGNHSGSES